MWRATTLGALAVAIIAAVFAIWPAVADAPWEDDPAESGSEAAFKTREVIRIVQAQVEDGGLYAIVDGQRIAARSVRCTEAKYLVDNGKWIVECQFRGFGTLPQDAPIVGRRSYVFDDATGRIVE